MIAGIGGYLGSAIARDISQRRLDEAYELSDIPPRVKPDSPLKLKPEVKAEVLPEIKVVAKRLYKRAPMPQFFSVDDDPWEMQTVYPRELEPAAAPEIVLSPLEIPAPTLPGTLPAPTEFPISQPFSDPLAQPFATPLAQPFSTPLAQPFADPLAQPFATPIPTPTGVTLPGNLTTPQGLALPLPQAQPQPQTRPATAGCPPCPKTKCKKTKEKKKKRDQCYRQLVKQGRYEELDQVYQWAEIDCDTGRELNY